MFYGLPNRSVSVRLTVSLVGAPTYELQRYIASINWQNTFTC